MTFVRVLTPDDQQALIVFLEKHIDSSLILLSDAEAAGLEDHGQPLQGTYAASFVGSEMHAVAAHYWNGMVIVQGDLGLEDAARAAVAHTGRPLNGIIGPEPLALRARRALGAEEWRATTEDPEILFGLDLKRLKLPRLLCDPRVTCRRPGEHELTGILLDWRLEYVAESLGQKPTPAVREEARETLGRLKRQWVLCHDGQPVAYSAFNAETHGVVQVGGVFTPRHLRGRGYGRAVVGASLVDAHREGWTRSVLFTPRSNIAAQRAYGALGFERIGEYALLLFER